MLGIAAITEWVRDRREESTLRKNLSKLESHRLRLLNANLKESIQFLDNYVDPNDAWNDDGGNWTPVGSANARWDRHYGLPFTTQDEHDRIRSYARYLANENEFAIGILETRVSYIVGTGHVYEAEPKDKDDELSEQEKAQLAEVLDEFVKDNQWHDRQQEIQRRLDRDGECFLRFFNVDLPAEEGESTSKAVRVRFVEPSQVRTPESLMTDEAASYGIRTAPDDVETVLAYYVDGNPVDAAEIQHRKRNVDRNCKRGLSLLYACRKNLPRADKVIRNAAATVEIQAAVGMVRKHAQATQAAVQSFVAGKADAQVRVNTPSGASKLKNFQQFSPGQILDVPGTTEYEFPAMGLDPSKPAGTVQMILRATGSRCSLPEFMVSGDASNANYASTLVAEGPAVKGFQRAQWTLIEEDEEVFDRVLALAVESGRLSQELVDRVKICAEPPNVVARDELQGAQKNQILANQGIKSPQTWCLEEGLDYEHEQQNMEEHVERTGGTMVRAQAPGDLPDEEGDEDKEKKSDRPGQA